MGPYGRKCICLASSGVRRFAKGGEWAGGCSSSTSTPNEPGKGSGEPNRSKQTSSDTGGKGPEHGGECDRHGTTDGSGKHLDVDMVQEALQEQIELAMANYDGECSSDVADVADGGGARKERAAKLAAKIHGGVLQRITKQKSCNKPDKAKCK